jgi:pimeloyl-ACP methyl ester carboxylesterase
MVDFLLEPATRACRGCAVLFFMLALGLCGCRLEREPYTNAVPPTPELEGITRERRQVRFASQGVTLAGELDLPLGDVPVPLVFVIHHSGPVDRDSYGYLAELLVKEGYAVFRFDKRGTGMSDGEYGCCEGQDALAAYRAAATQDGIDRYNVFIVAQSVGTQHLAERFEGYVQAHPPRGVVLLSNLLDADSIDVIAAPVHIIISDSEPNVDQLGRAAAEAHRYRYPFGASYYVAEQTEHTLFDIRDGPIDWNDPEWTRRYHRGAMGSLIDWLNGHLVVPESCP